VARSDDGFVVASRRRNAEKESPGARARRPKAASGPSRKRARTSTKAAATKICDACGAENLESAERCTSCNKQRWAPSWVRQLRRVNRNFAVQVTTPHEQTSTTNPSLTLYKWWPGGRSTLHVRTQDHWDRIKEIVDTELAEHLGWASKEKIAKEIRSRKRVSKEFDTEAEALLADNPQLLVNIARSLRVESLSEEELPRVAESLGKIAEILAGVDESHQLAIRQLVEKLQSKRPRRSSS
jgi:hypothetical protein